MAKNDQRSEMDSESEVWQAISAFEQILEVMPDDRSSLETLSHAYEHVGDRARALDYLLRLAAVVVAEKDGETAPHVLERLAEYGEADEQVRSMIQQLKALQPEDEQADADSAAEPDEQAQPKKPKDAPRAFRVTDELALAWKLLEAGEISQEDYSQLAQDLAELSTDSHMSTVSVLHVLDTKNYAGLERVMGYISRDTKTPIVSVQSFDVSAELAGLLPMTYMVQHGVIIFGSLMDDLLVAIMNPGNQPLRDDVIARTGQHCHFFMTPPHEFDALITSLKSSP